MIQEIKKTKPSFCIIATQEFFIEMKYLKRIYAYWILDLLRKPYLNQLVSL